MCSDFVVLILKYLKKSILRNIITLVLFICTITFIHAQNTRLLNGKITSEIETLDGISILNSTQNYEKVTLQGGYFSLKVSLKDTLIFKSEFLHDLTHIVSESDFKTDLLQLTMIKRSTMLEEVQIFKKPSISSLTILDQPAKQYTTAERRLKTAKDGPVDVIANAFNGKSSELKKLINLQKEEKKEQVLLDVFNVNELISDYNIPPDMLYSFAQYAYNDSAVKSALKQKNKYLLRFLLIDISSNFIKDYKLN